MAKDLSLYPHRQDPGTLLLDKVIHEFLNLFEVPRSFTVRPASSGVCAGLAGRLGLACAVAGLPAAVSAAA